MIASTLSTVQNVSEHSRQSPIILPRSDGLVVTALSVAQISIFHPMHQFVLQVRRPIDLAEIRLMRDHDCNPMEGWGARCRRLNRFAPVKSLPRERIRDYPASTIWTSTSAEPFGVVTLSR